MVSGNILDYQELDDLPAGFSVPAGREKPWGTGQAILACKNVVDTPFAVQNADDYYGAAAFAVIVPATPILSTSPRTFSRL